MTLTQAAVLIRSRKVSCVELTKAALQRADELDEVLGTYLVRFDDQALAAAVESDNELSRGIDRGPLHGIPIGIKDLLAAREGETTAQSLILDRDWGKGRDATIVSRLRQ